MHKGLYQVCKLVRHEIHNHHIHAFGVGRKAWVEELVKIGIDSFDSATASFAMAFNRGISRVEGRRRTISDEEGQSITEFSHYEEALFRPNPQLCLF